MLLLGWKRPHHVVENYTPFYSSQINDCSAIGYLGKFWTWPVTVSSRLMTNINRFIRWCKQSHALLYDTEDLNSACVPRDSLWCDEWVYFWYGGSEPVTLCKRENVCVYHDLLVWVGGSLRMKKDSTVLQIDLFCIIMLPCRRSQQLVATMLTGSLTPIHRKCCRESCK